MIVVTRTVRGNRTTAENELMTEHRVCIEIGGMPVLIRTGQSGFAKMLRDRYGAFAGPPLENLAPVAPGPHSQGPTHAAFELEVELIPPGVVTDAEDVRVTAEGGRWVMERGDFHAEWDEKRGQGWVRQSANPYSLDSVLRILHSLILAREGGFLVHAASAIRKGQAFLFAGISGTGKTTMCRLAPPDVAILTDEISYVRKGQNEYSAAKGQKSGSSNSQEEGPSVNRQTAGLHHEYKIQDSRRYEAFGTPFAGELARIGRNLRAPIAGLFLLAKGRENRVEDVSHSDAARALLQNILFFATDAELVQRVFQSALDFLARVPVRRLVFAPHPQVWKGIGVGSEGLDSGLAFQ